MESTSTPKKHPKTINPVAVARNTLTKRLQMLGARDGSSFKPQLHLAHVTSISLNLALETALVRGPEAGAHTYGLWQPDHYSELVLLSRALNTFQSA